METFLGMIALFPYNFAPRGWAACEGQLLSIAQNTALFSLLGTTYGGDGRTTFALPDLRGRSPISQGNGPGLSPVQLGQVGGQESVTLQVNQLPAHNHTLAATNAPDNSSPVGNVPGNAGNDIYGPVSPGQFQATTAVGLTGGNQAVPVRNPFLALQWCIALEGIFPSRN